MAKVIDESWYKERARQMRREPTAQEARLWLELRKPPFNAYRFRRQHRLGTYIVDFYSARLKLVIEVDGGQHNEKSADVVRDAYLGQTGHTVLRFWNNQVSDNLVGVLEAILQRIPARPSPGSA